MNHAGEPSLAQAILADSETGLRWAMRDYAALVRGILRRILPRQEDDVEECLADVFVALWRNAQKLADDEIPVRAWLIVTARNMGINRYRALQRRREIPLTEEMSRTLWELSDWPQADAAEVLGALVAAMEPPDRDIFLRKYYLMQSSREIAAALHLSVANVNTRLSRGRQKLRQQLREGGITHG